MPVFADILRVLLSLFYCPPTFACAGYIRNLFRITGLSRTIYPFLHRLQTRSGKGKIRSRQDISCSSNDNLIFEGEAFLIGRVLPHLLQLRHHCLDILHACFLRWTKPLRTSLPLGTLADHGRSKSQLIKENASSSSFSVGR